jgi:peptidyl-prolyl cis-trans isomerase B (cyclophilin B)
VYQADEFRPGFSRRQPPKPEKKPSRFPTSWLLVGGLAIVAVVVVVAYAAGAFGGVGGPGPTPKSTVDATRIHPPSATPLASALPAPSGDGTQATIVTEQGTIVIELYTNSAPVASANFINLAEAGFYNGVGFHRIIPGFMIQGGDPEGTGRGGPGYTIPDEPFSGEYTRGVVAMARSDAPNSQGSQFFIVVDDSPHLDGGGYTIFGRVLSGMEVADAIVAGDTNGDIAVDPTLMTLVTVQRP